MTLAGPRVLYLDVNFRFIDPTRQTMPLVYAHAADVTFYGPGYVSEAVLERGVEAFVGEHGPFDVVVITELPLYHANPSLAQLSHYHSGFPASQMRFWGTLRQYFLSYRGIKVAHLLESDYYNFTEKYIGPMRDSDAYFLSYNHQMIVARADMPRIDEEIFGSRVNDNFHTFLSAAPDRFIPLVTSVLDSELWLTPLDQRPRCWSVPGAPYLFRQEARRVLSASGLLGRQSWPTPFQIYSLMGKLGLKPFRRRVPLQIYNLLFNVDLEQTRFVYTCGSALGYPLRKFFEIPAHGCLLVAVPFFGAADLGFVDGHTMIAARPDQLPEVMRQLERDPERAQTIASAGRRMIFERHGAVARGRQLREVLDALVAGTFTRALWSDGEFVVQCRMSAKSARA